MMMLYATPLSHYSRKVRILLDLWQLPYQFVDIGNVTNTDQDVFAGNPLMKVPVLVDGSQWIIDSDIIAQYLVEKYDPKDRYRVKELDWARLNIRAVMNGMMQEEVKLILAKRTGVPIDQYEFFHKSKQVLSQGLNWLETNASNFDSKNPGYLEFHLLCLWEHLDFFHFIDQSLDLPQLRFIYHELSQQPSIQKTSFHLLRRKKT